MVERESGERKSVVGTRIQEGVKAIRPANEEHQSPATVVEPLLHLGCKLYGIQFFAFDIKQYQEIIGHKPLCYQAAFHLLNTAGVIGFFGRGYGQFYTAKGQEVIDALDIIINPSI